jgi:hypothetical protein
MRVHKTVDTPAGVAGCNRPNPTFLNFSKALYLALSA